MQLLDYIAGECGTDILSELRHSIDWHKAIDSIAEPENFKLSEWNEAVAYLTARREILEHAEAKAYLRAISPKKNG